MEYGYESPPIPGARRPGVSGLPDIPTPHLDALAKDGVRFTSGLVSHPCCSPTRAGLMTGRYQQRFGHENNPRPDPRDEVAGLPRDQITLPQVLREAGYATGIVGKGHLGAAPSLHPMQQDDAAAISEPAGRAEEGDNRIRFLSGYEQGMKARVTISINRQTLLYVDRLIGKWGSSRSEVVESFIRESWQRQREAALAQRAKEFFAPPERADWVSASLETTKPDR